MPFILAALLLAGCRSGYVEVSDNRAYDSLGYESAQKGNDQETGANGAPSQPGSQLVPDSARPDIPAGTSGGAPGTLHPQSGSTAAPFMTPAPAVTTRPVRTTGRSTQAPPSQTLLPTQASTPSQAPQPTQAPKPALPPVTTLMPAETTRAPAPTTAPPKVTAPPTPSGTLTLLEFTRTVKKGSKATVTIQGTPNTQYSIKVKYSSGYSKAKGLEDQVSDASGVCSWSWRVGGSTKSGDYPVIISDGVNSYTLTLTVE